MTTLQRTQQQRRDQAETALLEAAAELVVEAGVHSLTLARVGERAGYSRGLVTHYFGSKQALLHRLAQATQSGFVPGLDGVPPGLDRLLRLIDGYIGALGEMRMLSRAFLLLWAEAATAPDLARLFRERDQAFRADLREDVAAGIADGSVRPDVAADEVAVAVLGQLRGIGLQRLVDSPAVDTELLRHSVTGQWRRALAVPPAGALLSAGHGADNEVGLGPGGHGCGQRVVGRVVGQVPFAGEEPDEGTPGAAVVTADGPAQHRIAGLQGVQHRPLGRHPGAVEVHLAVNP
ncbi:MAG TPA: TetR/AcrR family transcriptional regulator, partial [Trebonia sp.]